MSKHQGKFFLIMIVVTGLYLFTTPIFAKERIMKSYTGQPLTELQMKVTQEEGTEQPFHNTYWDNHRAGIYVDILTGEPLFISSDKFDSGTGWPSFTKPIDEKAVQEESDQRFGMSRTEVKARKSESHLGHVFDDGPKDRGGLRYCINSAALSFVPKEEMEEKGYGQFLYLLENEPHQ